MTVAMSCRAHGMAPMIHTSYSLIVPISCGELGLYMIQSFFSSTVSIPPWFPTPVPVPVFVRKIPCPPCMPVIVRCYVC